MAAPVWLWLLAGVAGFGLLLNYSRQAIAGRDGTERVAYTFTRFFSYLRRWSKAIIAAIISTLLLFGLDPSGMAGFLKVLFVEFDPFAWVVYLMSVNFIAMAFDVLPIDPILAAAIVGAIGLVLFLGHMARDIGMEEL